MDLVQFHLVGTVPNRPTRQPKGVRRWLVWGSISEPGLPIRRLWLCIRGKNKIATYAGKDRMVIIFATSSHHLRSPLAECEGVAETDDATIFFTLVDHLAHAPDEATHLNLRKIMGKGAVLDFSTKRVLREINCWGRRAMLGIIEVRLASATEFSLGFDFRKQEARFLQEHSDYFRGR